MNTLIAARNRFPQLAIAALAALTIVSFARTYYLRFLFDLPPLARAAHVHGLIATLWLVLHFTQARLIAAHRVALHKRLGIFTAGVGIGQSAVQQHLQIISHVARSRRNTVVIAALIGLIVITIVFQEIFLVRLP